MMAATLNSAMLNSDTAILDSDTLLSSLRFTQKHSHSNLTLNQINSIWLNLIPSHLTWWRQPFWFCHLGFSHFTQKNFTYSFWLNLMMAAIFNLAILDSAILVFLLKLTHTCQDWFLPFAQKKLHSFILIQLDDGSHLVILSCWIQTLPSWIQTPCYHLSDSLKNTLTPIWLWFKLIQSWLKLIPSHITWWWQPSWILPSRIHPFCTKLWLKLIQSDSNSFIVIQLDDGNHLEFCHLGFSHFAKNKLHSFILTQLDDGSHL